MRSAPSRPVDSALLEPLASRWARELRSIGAGWPIHCSASSDRATTRASALASETMASAGKVCAGSSRRGSVRSGVDVDTTATVCPAETTGTAKAAVHSAPSCRCIGASMASAVPPVASPKNRRLAALGRLAGGDASDVPMLLPSMDHSETRVPFGHCSTRPRSTASLASMSLRSTGSVPARVTSSCLMTATRSSRRAAATSATSRILSAMCSRSRSACCKAVPAA